MKLHRHPPRVVRRRPASPSRVGPRRTSARIAVASRVSPRRASGPDPCPKVVIPRTLRTSLHLVALTSPPAPPYPPVPTTPPLASAAVPFAASDATVCACDPPTRSVGPSFHSHPHVHRSTAFVHPSTFPCGRYHTPLRSIHIICTPRVQRRRPGPLTSHSAPRPYRPVTALTHMALASHMH